MPGIKISVMPAPNGMYRVNGRTVTKQNLRAELISLGMDKDSADRAVDIAEKTGHFEIELD